MIGSHVVGRISHGARHVVTYLRWLGPVTDGRPPAPFTRLSSVHWASAAGDAFLPIALAGSLFFSISLKAAQGRVALALLLTVAPFAVVGPLLGPLIDRLNGGRRSVVVVSAVGRAVAVYFMANYVHSLLLFPWALVALICSKGYSVTKAALVPAVVEAPSQLVEANSKLAIGSSVIGALAAAPAIAILKLLGGAAVLRADVAIYAVVAVLALRLEELPATPAPQASDVKPGPVRLVSGRPMPPGSLYLAWIAMASLRCVVGLLAFLVVFSFRRDGAPLLWYGVVGLSNVVGNLGGAAVAPRLRQRFGEWRILTGTTLVVGVVGAVVTQMRFVHRWPAALVFAGVLGLGANAAKLAFDALVQQHVAPADRPRLFARTETSFQLVWVVGALIPVLLSIGLLLGMSAAAALVLAAFATMVLGNRRAERAALPGWWPGTPRRLDAGPGPAGDVVGAGGSSGDYHPATCGLELPGVRWPSLDPGVDHHEEPPTSWVR